MRGKKCLLARLEKLTEVAFADRIIRDNIFTRNYNECCEFLSF